MIREIRDYFDARIVECDSDILEWKRDVFGNNDANKRIAQKYYNLVIGTASLDRDNSNKFLETIPVTLSIWTSTRRDISASFDELYDKARDIRNNIINYSSVLGASFTNETLIDVNNTTITPNEEPSNDNTLRMDVEFDVIIGFKF